MCKLFISQQKMEKSDLFMLSETTRKDIAAFGKTHLYLIGFSERKTLQKFSELYFLIQSDKDFKSTMTG